MRRPDRIGHEKRPKKPGFALPSVVLWGLLSQACVGAERTGVGPPGAQPVPVAGSPVTFELVNTSSQPVYVIEDDKPTLKQGAENLSFLDGCTPTCEQRKCWACGLWVSQVQTLQPGQRIEVNWDGLNWVVGGKVNGCSCQV